MGYSNFDFLTLILYLAIGLTMVIMVCCAERNSRCDDSSCDMKSYTLSGRITYVVMFTLLVFVASFRYVDVGVGGTDALNYINIFLSGQKYEFNLERIITLRQQEPLFYVITYYTRMVTSNPIVYFILIYSIISYCLIKFISSNFNKNMFMFPIILTIVNYIYSFSAIRSSLALAFGLVAINYYRVGNRIKSIFFVFIAAMFHYSALVIAAFFIFYEVYSRKFIKKKLTMFFSLLLFLVLMYFLIDFITPFLATSKYRVYLENQNNLRGQLPTIMFILITFIYHKPLVRLMGNQKIYVYCTYFNGLLIPAIMILGAYRLGDYFDLSKIVVMSYLIKVVGDKYSSNSKWGIFLVRFISYSMIFVWTTYLIIRTSSSAGLMPYINVLFR